MSSLSTRAGGRSSARRRGWSGPVIVLPARRDRKTAENAPSAPDHPPRGAFVPRTAPARPSGPTARGAVHPVPFRALHATGETDGMNGVGATPSRPGAMRSVRNSPGPLLPGRRGGVCFRLRPAKITARNSLRTCRLSRPGIRERSRGDWCREWEQRSRLTEYYYKSGPKCIRLASTERDRETEHSVDGGPISDTPVAWFSLFPVLRRPAAWSARREPRNGHSSTAARGRA